MAVTLVSSPIKTITPPALPPFISYTASTTQLLYEFNESVITPGEAYVLQVVVDFAGSMPDLTRFYVPQSNGDITFNIGPAIEGILLKSGITNSLYTIDYASIRNGVETPEGTTPAVLAVLSRRQILSTNGANLYEYVAKSTDDLGKILTNFDEPKLWYGWDKKAYWINQDLAVQYDMLQTYQDINKTDLSFDNDIKAITSNIVDEWLLVEPVSEPNAEYLRFTVQSGLQVVSRKWYRLAPECENPVMLSWINSLGGIDQWLFQTEQAIVNRSEKGRLFQRPITEDIETVRTTKGRFAPIDTQFMTLKVDQINQNELQSLHDIMRSEVVHLWLNKTGTEYVGVRVSAGYETTFTTGKTFYEFSINIELPDNFDFFTAKLY